MRPLSWGGGAQTEKIQYSLCENMGGGDTNGKDSATDITEKIPIFIFN